MKRTIVLLVSVLTLTASCATGSNTDKAKALTTEKVKEVESAPAAKKEGGASTSSETTPKGEIELGLEGDYKKVEVEENAAGSSDGPACETVKECYPEGGQKRDGTLYACTDGRCVITPPTVDEIE